MEDKDGFGDQPDLAEELQVTAISSLGSWVCNDFIFQDWRNIEQSRFVYGSGNERCWEKNYVYTDSSGIQSQGVHPAGKELEMD